jgi:hypothetical protein
VSSCNDQVTHFHTAPLAPAAPAPSASHRSPHTWDGTTATWHGSCCIAPHIITRQPFVYHFWIAHAAAGDKHWCCAMASVNLAESANLAQSVYTPEPAPSRCMCVRCRKQYAPLLWLFDMSVKSTQLSPPPQKKPHTPNLVIADGWPCWVPQQLGVSTAVC